MKEVIVISGKGGTGKTTLTAALSRIVKNKILVDTDVDASNLELLTEPFDTKYEIFMDGFTGIIDKDKCISCGACKDACRFDAISNDGQSFTISEDSCEGCKVCGIVCPNEAISYIEGETGKIKLSQTKYGFLLHGELSVGRDNSGKMVSRIRVLGKEKAKDENADFIIIDGAPGIGCQVISSLSGTDFAIAVTEPSLSAFHDLKRIVSLAEHFRIPIGVVINKYDINLELTNELEKWAADKNIEVLEKIPLDKRIILAMTELKSPMEIEDKHLHELYENIWNKALSSINK